MTVLVNILLKHGGQHYHNNSVNDNSSKFVFNYWYSDAYESVDISKCNIVIHIDKDPISFSTFYNFLK